MTRAFALTLAATLVLAGAGPALSPPAHAQAVEPDPLDDRSSKRLDRMEKVVRETRAIVFQGKETGQPVTVQPAETPAQIERLTERVADLEQTLIKANAQAETLGHDLAQARAELAQARSQTQAAEARLLALEGRLTAVETATADLTLAVQGPPPPPAPPVGETAPPPANAAGEAFDAAYALLKSGDNGKAQAAFNAFVTDYGDTPKGPEARYWLGETYYISKAYTEAAGAYIGAIRGWPTTSWAPDATLKLARSLVALGKPVDACRTLDELGRRYPKAAAPIPARVAATRLQAGCAR